MTTPHHRFGPAVKRAHLFGAALKAGVITAEHNADAMVLIHRHHMHGDVDLPELTEEQAADTDKYTKSFQP